MSGRVRLGALAVLITVGASFFAFARPAAADSNSDYFVSSINAIRTSRGLAPLAVDGQLTSVAAGWAQQMSADNTLEHNPNLAGQISGWKTAGENVGTGPTIESIEAAFEASPHHFENMVDPAYNAIGVAVAQAGNGTYWVTEDFKQSSGARPAPAPAPARPAPPAPRPVAHAAPRPATTPRPAAAPRPQPAAAAAVPVTTPAPATTVAPTTAPVPPVPLVVLGASTKRAPEVPVQNPFTPANLTGLIALVVLGASMALVVRVRMTRTTVAA